jgi:hypothetical protein
LWAMLMAFSSFGFLPASHGKSSGKSSTIGIGAAT